MNKTIVFKMVFAALLVTSCIPAAQGSGLSSSLEGLGQPLRLTAMSMLIQQGKNLFDSQFSFEYPHDSLSRFLRCVPSAVFYAEALKVGSGLLRTEPLTLQQELLLRAGVLGAVLGYSHMRKPFFSFQKPRPTYLLPTSHIPSAEADMHLSIDHTTLCSVCSESLLDNSDTQKGLLMQLPLCHCSNASFSHKFCYSQTSGSRCTTCKSTYYYPAQHTAHQLENGQWLINY